MYCPVFRNHNSVPHLLAKLCYIVSIKSSNIFDIISDLCIMLHPSQPFIEHGCTREHCCASTELLERMLSL